MTQILSQFAINVRDMDKALELLETYGNAFYVISGEPLDVQDD